MIIDYFNSLSGFTNLEMETTLSTINIEHCDRNIMHLPIKLTENPSNSAHLPIPAKRSLFKRPSWSKPQALVNGADPFHRSSQTYIDHAAEVDRQRKKRLARRQIERARRAEVNGRAGKRQRMSESEDDEDDDLVSDGSSCHFESKQLEEEHRLRGADNDAYAKNPRKIHHSSNSVLKCHGTTITTDEFEPDENQKASVSQIIDLECEDGTLHVPAEGGIVEITASKALSPSNRDDEPVSDEEFPELAQLAREKALQKYVEESTASAYPDALATSQDGDFQQSQDKHQSTPPPPPPDPILQILITSSIPDTTPLIVNRKLSQRLKDVRLAWTERQQFSAAFADKVILTWRGKRLFDVTTCRSLGISTDPNGRISAKGENVVDEDGRIHMEAMTPEILEVRKRGKTNDCHSEEESVSKEAGKVQQTQEAQLKIICRAKGFADFKLIVKEVIMLQSPRMGMADMC